jgi:hypothetical protein
MSSRRHGFLSTRFDRGFQFWSIQYGLHLGGPFAELGISILRVDILPGVNHCRADLRDHSKPASQGHFKTGQR